MKRDFLQDVLRRNGYSVPTQDKSKFEVNQKLIDTHSLLIVNDLELTAN